MPLILPPPGPVPHPISSLFHKTPCPPHPCGIPMATGAWGKARLPTGIPLLSLKALYEAFTTASACRTCVPPACHSVRIGTLVGRESQLEMNGVISLWTSSPFPKLTAEWEKNFVANITGSKILLLLENNEPVALDEMSFQHIALLQRVYYFISVTKKNQTKKPQDWVAGG